MTNEEYKHRLDSRVNTKYKWNPLIYDIVGMYRSKQNIVSIGGIAYNAPEQTAPKIGTKYWLIFDDGGVSYWFWDDNVDDKRRLNYGNVFLNEEYAKNAAIARAKLNIGLTEN